MPTARDVRDRPECRPCPLPLPARAVCPKIPRLCASGLPTPSNGARWRA
jgi:hypothetical protein